MKSKFLLSSLAAFLLAGSAQGQYTDNNQTNIITGATSNWVGNGTYVVGSNTFFDTLIVQGGGVLSNGTGYIGYETSGSNNTTIVRGSGSSWINQTNLYIGYGGAGNELIISNGASVADSNAFIGALNFLNNTNNLVVVSGPGSVWTNSGGLIIGALSKGNELIVTNGGTVIDQGVEIGDHSGASTNGQFIDNSALVTGTNSTWINYGFVSLDRNSPGNVLTIANGGGFFSSGEVGIANSAASGGITVLVTDPGSTWTNDGVLQVGGFAVFSEFVISNGASAYSVDAFINPNTISNAVVVTGPGSFWDAPDSIFVSEFGADGFLIITNGGTVQTPLEVIADFTGSSGKLIVAGGTNYVYENLQVGPSGGTGTVSVSSGALFVTNATGTASTLINGPGSALILGAGTFKTDILTVTNGGAVEYVQTYQVDNASVAIASNSVVQADSSYVVAPSANSTGNVSVAGGQLVATNGVIGIGNDGTTTNGLGVGTMTVSNGTVLGSSIFLGSSAGGQGSLTIQTNGVVSLDSGAAGSNASVVANDLILDGGLLSMTNGTLYCGSSHPGAMTMSNGTALCQTMYVGYDYSGTMTMLAGQMNVSSLLVIGHLAGSTGSVWMSSGQCVMTNLPTTVGNAGVGQLSLSNGTIQASTIFVGNTGSPGGMLAVSGGTLALNGNLNVGTPIQSTGTVWVTGGQLLVASGAIIVGNNSGKGQLTISNGFVQANSLVLTNGTKSVFTFSGGSLISSGTSVTNGQNFRVGNGSSAATFTMAGGGHWFGNGLEIANNGTLTGCGTIEGNVTVDPDGTVFANCGGTLTFAVIVTNNGTMRAIAGSILESYGTVVNNGTIDIINGGTSFHGAFVNNGTVLNASSVIIGQVSKSGQDMVIQIPSVTGHTYQLQYATSLTPANWTNTGASQSGTGLVLTFTDPGGATNVPSRFYQVDCTAP